jgi:hypothetical protein
MSTSRNRFSKPINPLQRCLRGLYRWFVPSAKWSAEKRYVAGRFPSPSGRQSVVLLTVHKCASVFLGERLALLAREIGLAPLNLGSYCFATDQSITVPLNPRGFFFGPYRAISHFDDAQADLRQFQTILVIRDPRDVLTSLYYSVAFSHKVPPGESGRKMQARRQQAISRDLDAFVLESAPLFAQRYQEFLPLLTWDNVHLCKYEDLVSDPARWLAKLTEFLAADVDAEFVASLITPQDFVVDGEDRRSHKRQVTPGDHRRKLQPATIAALDRQFSSVLDTFGYFTDAARAAG